jgi:4-amino-4-deoxychorismate lyase
MLAFGDGLFETCLVTTHGIRFVDDHLQRLAEGVQRLNIAWTKDDERQLLTEIETVIKSVTRPSVLKITLGRRAAGRGYDYDPQSQQTDRLLQLFEHQPPDWYTTGARVVTSDIPASINPALAGIKHLNRLDSVMARQSARKERAQEAILCDGHGMLVEGSMSNVFFRKNGQWCTPRLVNAGVNGIIRRRWLRAKRQPLAIADIRQADLGHCEALLLGNSLMGLVPVTHLDKTSLDQPDESELALIRTDIGLNVD